MNNLRRIDLNLLVTLHALLVEKHISRAALRLHKSQPAVSHALAHLRKLFDDPLLIRRSGKLELTSRAAELMQPLTDALGQLGTLLDPPQFDPTRAQRVFRLAMSDYGARVVLPGLVRTLRTIAPGVELVVSQASREAMLADVIDGEIDMAMGVFPSRAPDELRMRTLFVEHFACLADASTLPETGMLDREAWLARPHVLVAMRAGADNEIDRTLGREGMRRRIAVLLPHWGVANELIAGTDLILTVARRSLGAIGSDPRVRVFDLPFPIEPFDFKLIWHQRREGDPAYNWLRQVIMRVVSDRWPADE
ncbi:LysR substrate-binding domain-containing protein [Pseudomonas mangiferae]|uniref:LysR family transcriptional regulator n=1 Tax=Pseudomonas mangiferae TaxID=2593654 RepID=A0A553H1Y5_9PSED|nr:LysR substrate-binding domain-containing protein [Pseudomonas mangiferae]TRX75751.1 LysR family transcriptional regulator [Pseudomonas mangiferae]